MLTCNHRPSRRAADDCNEVASPLARSQCIALLNLTHRKLGPCDMMSVNGMDQLLPPARIVWKDRPQHPEKHPMDTNTLALASIGAGLQLVPRAPHLPQHRGGRSCPGGANYHRALRVARSPAAWRSPEKKERRYAASKPPSRKGAAGSTMWRARASELLNAFLPDPPAQIEPPAGRRRSDPGGAVPPTCPRRDRSPALKSFGNSWRMRSVSCCARPMTACSRAR